MGLLLDLAKGAAESGTPNGALDSRPKAEELANIHCWLHSIGEPDAAAWVERARTDPVVARDLLWLSRNKSGDPPWLH